MPRTCLFVAPLCFLALVAHPPAAGAADSPGPQNFPAPLGPYLQKHCLKCHGEKSDESDFRLDNLSARIGFENTPQWLEVMERISSGEMPPENAPSQPTPAESASLIGWMAEWMKEGETARLAARGRVSYNRLTRDEYVNTVRDLIGVQFDATDPGGFLEDPEWHGFERIGSVFTLSPANIEKYLAAAETILAEAYPPVKPAFLDFKKRAVEEKQIDEPHLTRLRELGLLDKVRFEMWAGDIYRYTGSEPLPEAGIYEISYTLSGLKPKLDPADASRLSRKLDMTAVAEYHQLFFDLMLMAFRTDSTRVITCMICSESSGGAIPDIGISQTRHGLSHHNGDPEQLRRLTQTDTFLIEQLAVFLDKLKSVKEADGSTLLETTQVLWGSGMAYGHSHGNANLPTILAGGRGRGHKHGQHVDFNLPTIGKYDVKDAGGHYKICSRPVDGNARLSNLLLTMLHQADMQADAFQDSVRPLTELCV